MQHFKPSQRQRGLVAVRANAPDTGAVIAELTKAFGDFRKQYDGKVTDLAACIDDLMKSEARALIGSGSRDANASTPENFRAHIRAALRRDAPLDAEQVRMYGSALDLYLRVGKDAAGPDIMSAMRTGSDSDGGFLVLPDRADGILTRVRDSSPMRQIGRVVQTTGDEWQEVVDHSEITASWVQEESTSGETTSPRIGLLRVPVYEMQAEPRMTQQLLEDSSLDLGGYLSERIGDRFGRLEATAFISGTGVGQPRGLLTYDLVTTDDDARAEWGTLQYVLSGAAGGFPKLSGSTADDPGALFDIIAKLKPIYRTGARWLMNRATANVIRKLRDSQGRFLWVDGLREGEADRLLGFPVSLGEDMPDLASDSLSVAFGDFGRGYVVVDRLGISILRDPFTSKPYVKFYSRKRVGGSVRDFDAIKIMKFAAA